MISAKYCLISKDFASYCMCFLSSILKAATGFSHFLGGLECEELKQAHHMASTLIEEFLKCDFLLRNFDLRCTDLYVQDKIRNIILVQSTIYIN